MFKIETPRFLLIQTPLEVIRKRLASDEFEAVIDGQTARFPPEWPGDALPMFASWAEHLGQNPNAEDWGGTLLEKASRTAVGQMGCKGLPDAGGMVEIGYGINPSFWGRGYATEAVQALVDWLWTQPSVRGIKAETLPDNIASRRVLEKTGFVQVGQRVDPDDGNLLLWEHRR